MMTKTRRECIVLGSAFLFSGFCYSNSRTDFTCDRELQDELVGDFRKAIDNLQPPAPDLTPTAAQISEVKRVGQLVLRAGITRLKPNNAIDRACNHWLASIQSS
jgi:hypothetical protein